MVRFAGRKHCDTQHCFPDGLLRQTTVSKSDFGSGKAIMATIDSDRSSLLFELD